METIQTSLFLSPPPLDYIWRAVLITILVQTLSEDVVLRSLPAVLCLLPIFHSQQPNMPPPPQFSLLLLNCHENQHLSQTGRVREREKGGGC